MNEFNDGGPAFPGTEENYKFEGSAGMSLRDYFAAKAMQSMVAAEFAGTHAESYWAESAYKMADAMIVAREPK